MLMYKKHKYTTNMSLKNPLRTTKQCYIIFSNMTNIWLHMKNWRLVYIYYL